MKFLLDAHIPPRLVRRLRTFGHDTVHVSTLPDGTATADHAIIALADLEGRIVVTKDSDFRYARRDHGRPARLLLIMTGNVGRNELIDLVVNNLAGIEALFAVANCGELQLTGLSDAVA